MKRITCSAPSSNPARGGLNQEEQRMAMASTSLIDLDAFAYEPGEWRRWDAAQWNQELLLYCFVRDNSRLPSAPLRASIDDLPELVREPEANPSELAEALLKAVRWQARQADLDPLEYALRRGQLRGRSGNRPPDFFAFLWLTCLIAYGYPDADLEGKWHTRFDRVFPRCNSRLLVGLPDLWQYLAKWLNQGQTFEGHPYTQLVLPATDLNRTNISHSWRLAFPLLVDRRRLTQALGRCCHNCQYGLNSQAH